MADKTINLDGPLTITLEPNEVQVILSVLKKQPYELVAVLFDRFIEASKPKAEEPPP